MPKREASFLGIFAILCPAKTLQPKRLRFKSIWIGNAEASPVGRQVKE